jgi:lipoyl(octanoyl) transferase
MDYGSCWNLQRAVADARAKGHVPDTLLLVEHDPVITYGSAFRSTNLLLSEAEYLARGIQLYQTDRGGDVTYHGPRQLVIYPIFDIRCHGSDLHKWLRSLEEAVIVALSAFRIDGERFPPHTGVWTGGKKIAAIGIKVSRWVNLHGIALNCNNDLSPYSLIIPCGIKGYGVTSLQQVTGHDISISDAIPKVVASFAQEFDARLEEISAKDLEVELKSIGKTA